MKNLLILLFILSTVSCNFPNKILINYMPEKLQTDSTFIHSAFKTVDTIALEEDFDVIINEISSASISRDGKYLAVTSPASKQLIIYNYNEGTIEKVHNSYAALSDSFALSGRKPPEFSYNPDWETKKWSYITHNELTAHGRALSDTIMMNNMFLTALFDDNTLYCNALLYIPAESGNNDNSIMWDNASVLMKFDDDFSNYTVIYIEKNDSNHCLAYHYRVADNFIMTSSNYPKPDIYGLYDSLVSVVEYDKYSGDIVDILGFLPDSYSEYRVAYELWWQPLIETVNNKLFITYPLDNHVFGKNNKALFEFHNLPYSNVPGLKLFNDYVNLKKQKKALDKNLLHKLYPVKLLKMFAAKGNLCFIFQIFEPSAPENSYFLVQEYSIDGRLLSENTIRYTTGSVIKNFAWDEYNDYLLIFKKNAQGWFMERLSL